MKFWQTPQYQALEEEWYQRLKDSGFVDIEERRDLGGTLTTQRSGGAYRHQKDAFIRQSRRDYFILLGQHAQAEPFDYISDHIILIKRSEGWQLNEIAASLGCYRNTVRYIIRKYEMRWGIREYTFCQLHPNYRRDNLE